MFLKIEVGMLRNGMIYVNSTGKIPLNEEKFIVFFKDVIEKFE